MEFAVLFGSFLVLILLTVPVGYAIGISTLITLYFFSDISFVMISQNAVAGVDSFSLLAIPFFILAGSLMSAGGLAKRLLNFANICVGAVTGGLAMVTTVTCMFFAALSGSAVATTSAVGSFMIPAMKERATTRDLPPRSPLRPAPSASSSRRASRLSSTAWWLAPPLVSCLSRGSFRE